MGIKATERTGNKKVSIQSEYCTILPFIKIKELSV